MSDLWMSDSTFGTDNQLSGRSSGQGSFNLLAETDYVGAAESLSENTTDKEIGSLTLNKHG